MALVPAYALRKKCSRLRCAARLRAAAARTAPGVAADECDRARNACVLPLPRLQPDAPAAARAPITQHRASAARAATHEKAMAACAARLGRLVSALHGLPRMRKRAVLERAAECIVKSKKRESFPVDNHCQAG